jgi:hypothetical protein
MRSKGFRSFCEPVAPSDYRWPAIGWCAVHNQLSTLNSCEFPRYLARNEKLDQIYQAAADNRRLRASLEDLVLSWDGLNRLVQEHNETRLSAVQRDGHCHEAVMWYA